MPLKEQLEQLKERFLQLSLRQKILVVGVPLVALGLLLSIILYTASPSYSLLYSGLSEEDMKAILLELDKEGIKYQIGKDGRSVYIPEDKVKDVRLKLAAKGIPNKGIVGYELFDQKDLFLSDFQQRINFKRAVEGELARTIMGISAVDSAKVNIALPEKSIFAREEEEPSASVFVKLKPGYELTPEQVKAIRNLVAASVPNLKSKNVVVIDDRGNDLTAMVEEDKLNNLTDKELKIKLEFEKSLEKKVQNALEEALGPGSVKVKVSADLDLSQTQTKEEIYDPDMTAVVSQQKKKERVISGGVGGVPGAQSNIPPGTGAITGQGQVLSEKSDTITNYEVSKKEVYTQGPSLKIKRLSVGVIVNSDIKNIDVNKIKNIVSAAVGLDPNRGDVITVEAWPFRKPEVSQVSLEERMKNLIPILLLSLFSFIVLVVVFTALKRLRKAPKETPVSVPPLEEVKGVEELRYKAKEIEVIEIVAKAVKDNPEATTKLIKSWLRSNT
ncbi:flagellar basal-body MS-ring/collar protein FliF [Thermocrinis minervae]|uniref:Flagellar M-ring protein n=1 Tax=Thermocrinis minervae TaxID=381751 RepID=A0A1M6SKN8_9AQUI|nr:flagellar basal-body MS-ring/collar protein FliF [Thermocrinis minervae]SHK45275.1 flagellar M-ring protein FliF [Thermocrinis minervae]